MSAVMNALKEMSGHLKRIRVAGERGSVALLDKVIMERHLTRMKGTRFVICQKRCIVGRNRIVSGTRKRTWRRAENKGGCHTVGTRSGKAF